MKPCLYPMYLPLNVAVNRTAVWFHEYPYTPLTQRAELLDALDPIRRWHRGSDLSVQNVIEAK